jgi:hypothetical protein
LALPTCCKRLAAVVLCAASAHAWAQSEPATLPTVRITGTAECSSVAAPAATRTQPEVASTSQLSVVVARLKDVRCSASVALINTTSKSDLDDRWLAATSVYAKLRSTADIFRSTIVEQVVNPSDGKTYEAFDVVYADGGTEKWMIVPSSASPVKLFEPPTAGSGSLAQELAGAADLKQFAADAVRRPELGGIGYAAYATALCRSYYTLHAASGLNDRTSIPYDAKQDPVLHAKRVSYMQAMERRCASFSPKELSAAQASSLSERETQERDRLWAIRERYAAATRSGDEEQRLDAAAQALRTRDPLLLAHLAHKLVMTRSNGRLGYTLDGSFYPVMQEGGPLHVALELLPCQFGLPCDSRDLNVVQACITHSRCFANKEALLTSELSPEDMQRVAYFLRRLTVIVNSGETSAFRRR